MQTGGMTELLSAPNAARFRGSPGHKVDTRAARSTLRECANAASSSGGPFTGIPWVFDVTGLTARALAVLGIPLGISIASFVVLDRGWILAVASAAILLALVFGEVAFEVWRQERLATKAKEDELGAVSRELAQREDERSRKLREAAVAFMDEPAMGGSSQVRSAQPWGVRSARVCSGGAGSVPRPLGT